jgi:hypothetical protein
MRWVEHIVYVGENKSEYKLLIGKFEGNIPLGRPRYRWEDNILAYRSVVKQ